MSKLFIYTLITILFFDQVYSEELNKNNQNDKYSQSTFGGIGLIQNPTARFSNDGEFVFGISSEEPYNRLYAKMQFFPWLEAVLRYTEGEFEAYNPGSEQTWKDKGLDFKIRLLEEKKILPELALGLRDIGGTGAYSGEYIVASKLVNNFDFTLGIGWGALSGVDHFNNPIAWIDKNREERGGYSERGGKLSLGRLFSGESASLFGGFEYFSPIPNLSYKVEYDTSDYSRAEGKSIVFNEESDLFDVKSRINHTINYRLLYGERDKVDLSVGFLRGNTIYANFSVHSNLNFKGTDKVSIGAEKLRNINMRAASYDQLEENQKEFLTNRIIKEMARAGFVTHRVIFSENELAAEISQSRFLDTVKYIDLASRILANNALPSVKTVTVINIDSGIETIRSSINVSSLKKIALLGPTPEEYFVFNEKTNRNEVVSIENNENLYPNLYWEIRPQMLGTLQHQEKFYFWQLQSLFHSVYSLDKGLYLTTDIGINIANNYDDYTYHIPDGQLHHVRQDRRLYLTEGESGLRRMSIDYLMNISSNLKAKISAGYLEWMFGGLGGEILYIPDSKRWGLSLDAYFVKQRDFNQRFSFKDYETITGFLSYYQDIPYYNMRIKVSAGKFLGKDIGAHIDVSRRFDTGARVGGIIALTDCDATCVGEGSFNKWIYFQLPMDLFYTSSTTRNKTGYAWAPLTKDAGQKVEVGGLYDLIMNATDEIDLLRQKPWSVKKIIKGFSTKKQDRSSL
jgi:hypothetical protein